MDCFLRVGRAAQNPYFTLSARQVAGTRSINRHIRFSRQRQKRFTGSGEDVMFSATLQLECNFTHSPH